jgi:hypothetical protein
MELGDSFTGLVLPGSFSSTEDLGLSPRHGLELPPLQALMTPHYQVTRELQPQQQGVRISNTVNKIRAKLAVNTPKHGQGSKLAQLRQRITIVANQGNLEHGGNDDDHASDQLPSNSMAGTILGGSPSKAFAGDGMDDDDDGEELQALKRDPFVLAGLELARHGDLKNQLFQMLTRTEAQGTVLARELELEQSAQEEQIKSSVTKRKLIGSLADQVRHELLRRDRLLLQRQMQRHAIIVSLESTLRKLSDQRADLEAQVSTAELRHRSEKAGIFKMRGVVADAMAKADQVEKLGLRVARRTATAAEKSHRGDVERWLSLLRGETEDDRRRRAKEKRLNVLRRTMMPKQDQLASYLRPDLEFYKGAMGDGPELEELLETRSVQTTNDRIEKSYKLQVTKTLIAMKLYAPDKLKRHLAKEREAKAVDPSIQSFTTVDLGAIMRLDDDAYTHDRDDEDDAVVGDSSGDDQRRKSFVNTAAQSAGAFGTTELQRTGSSHSTIPLLPPIGKNSSSPFEDSPATLQTDASPASGAGPQSPDASPLAGNGPDSLDALPPLRNQSRSPPNAAFPPVV